MKDLAFAFCSDGRHEEGIALQAKACGMDTKDTVASLKLAVWQTWFGHKAEYEATRARLIQQAEGTDNADMAERAAKAYCMRPSSDAAMLARVLQMTKRSVELGQNDPGLPWSLQALGYAEYRNGHYAEAERVLAGAENGGNVSNARVFRAMSLFRQDKLDEARKVFHQVEPKPGFVIPPEGSMPRFGAQIVSQGVIRSG